MSNPKWTSLPVQKWGGIASLLMGVAFFTASILYFTGNLRDPFGAQAYALADFLYGPVWAASLVLAIFAVREQIGQNAPRRMNLALIAAIASACTFVAVAFIRSSNRSYHLMHPELHLESNATILILWTTLVAGVIAAAWHFLGWALLLIGSAGWTSRRLPRLLSALYLLAGASALFVYLEPELEMFALMLVVVVSIWQGILLLTASGEVDAPNLDASRLDQA